MNEIQPAPEQPMQSSNPLADIGLVVRQVVESALPIIEQRLEHRLNVQERTLEERLTATLARYEASFREPHMQHSSSAYAVPPPTVVIAAPQPDL